MAEGMPSLLCLEDELSCSICSFAFKNPVTLPCGHSFCQGCLDNTWKESFLLLCPRCRHQYSSKPELRKNTVLSAIVETLQTKLSLSDSDHIKNVTISNKEPEVIKCDICMEAKAFKTCLTCMASFCEEHVKPHQENPIFRPHRLTDPLGDLKEHICQVHDKIVEFFCQIHHCSICSTCLQQLHRGCENTTLQERRIQKESEVRGMLHLLDRQIDKNNIGSAQVRQQQLQMQNDAAARKKMVSTAYQLIRDLINRDEQEALKAVDKVLNSSQTKIQSQINKLGKNVGKMTVAKAELNSLLSTADSVSFLKASVQLDSCAKADPYCPNVNMDSKTVLAHHSSALAVKELLNKLLTLPAEDRVSLLKPAPSKSSVISPMASLVPEMPCEKTCSHGEQPAKSPKATARGSSGSIPGEILTGVKRSDLLQFATVLKLDPRTVHKRIGLTKDLTKASMAREPCEYPDGPARFAVCTQVLCTEGFTQGRHYWEVKMTKNKLCALGLAYGRIDRKGPRGRLGLNAESWCLEWFNEKLSAWHNGVETELDTPSPSSSRVGVLLDCDAGSATFYMVTDCVSPFHTFVFSFREAVYPAFWISSADCSISLCKLTT